MKLQQSWFTNFCTFHFFALSTLTFHSFYIFFLVFCLTTYILAVGKIHRFRVVRLLSYLCVLATKLKATLQNRVPVHRDLENRWPESRRKSNVAVNRPTVRLICRQCQLDHWAVWIPPMNERPDRNSVHRPIVCKRWALIVRWWIRLHRKSKWIRRSRCYVIRKWAKRSFRCRVLQLSLTGKIFRKVSNLHVNLRQFVVFSLFSVVLCKVSLILIYRSRMGCFRCNRTLLPTLIPILWPESITVRCASWNNCRRIWILSWVRSIRSERIEMNEVCVLRDVEKKTVVCAVQ